jgi:hypothetical protein
MRRIAHPMNGKFSRPAAPSRWRAAYGALLAWVWVACRSRGTRDDASMDNNHPGIERKTQWRQ